MPGDGEGTGTQTMGSLTWMVTIEALCQLGGPRCRVQRANNIADALNVVATLLTLFTFHTRGCALFVPYVGSRAIWL